ncbi:hypothetical protein BSKO_00183 [Bryopsis sp. KO-2023]|nr:hypothetical protein BSKO_00183 [Bryopsis sp. KO-2023]
MFDVARSWDGIPGDIFHYVLEHSTDLSALRLVCKQWAAWVDQNVKRVKLKRLKAGFLRRFVSLTSLDLVPYSSSSKFSRRLIADLTGLKQLRSLKLGSNVPLSGPYLTPLTQLQILILDYHKKIRSTTLTNLTSLHHLTSLSLAGWDKLEDRSLPPLLALTNLQTLRLDDAKITDSGLQTVGKLSTLTTLSLNSCVLVGNGGLAALAALRNLKSLDVCWCYRITDEGLRSISQFPNLRVLDLTHLHNISDRGVADLGGLSMLERLSLSFCRNITDDGLVGLTPLTGLTALDLAYCYHITDEGLGSIRALTNLRKLNVEYCCNLRSDMMTGLQGLSYLTEVRFFSGRALWCWNKKNWRILMDDE